MPNTTATPPSSWPLPPARRTPKLRRPPEYPSARRAADTALRAEVAATTAAACAAATLATAASAAATTLCGLLASTSDATRHDELAAVELAAVEQRLANLKRKANELPSTTGRA